MIRLTLDTTDIERLLQGKTVVKHKHMAGTGRAMMQADHAKRDRDRHHLAGRAPGAEIGARRRGVQ